MSTDIKNSDASKDKDLRKSWIKNFFSKAWWFIKEFLLFVFIIGPITFIAAPIILKEYEKLFTSVETYQQMIIGYSILLYIVIRIIIPKINNRFFATYDSSSDDKDENLKYKTISKKLRDESLAIHNRNAIFLSGLTILFIIGLMVFIAERILSKNFNDVIIKKIEEQFNEKKQKLSWLFLFPTPAYADVLDEKDNSLNKTDVIEKKDDNSDKNRESYIKINNQNPAYANKLDEKNNLNKIGDFEKKDDNSDKIESYIAFLCHLWRHKFQLVALTLTPKV